MRALKRAAAGAPADPADPKRRKRPPAVPALRLAFSNAPRFPLGEAPRGEPTRDEPSTEPEGGETPPESALDARRARRARSHPVSPSPPPEHAAGPPRQRRRH